MKLSSLAPVRHGSFLLPKSPSGQFPYPQPELPNHVESSSTTPALWQLKAGLLRFGKIDETPSTSLVTTTGDIAYNRLLQVVTAPQVQSLLSMANQIKQVYRSPRLTSHHIALAALQQAIAELDKDYYALFPNRLDRTVVTKERMKDGDSEIEKNITTHHFNETNQQPIINGLVPENLYRQEVNPNLYDLKQYEKLLKGKIKAHKLYILTHLSRGDLVSILKTYNNWLLKTLEEDVSQGNSNDLEREETFLVRLVTRLAADKKSDLQTADILKALAGMTNEEARKVSPTFHQVHEAFQNIKEDAEALVGDGSDTAQMRGSINTAFEQGGMPAKVRRTILAEIKRLEEDPRSHEANYIRTWVRRATKLPWTKTQQANIDLIQAKQILDRDHYGMEKVKKRILSYMASLKQNPHAQPKILFLVGPPGVGKTSITKAVAEALGRNYVRRSVGGLTDEKAIKGHHRTYVGARHGMIMDAMMEAGTMNPVFVLDEAEKLGGYSADQNVEATKAALLEILDPEQNHAFQDTYFEFPYSLKDVFFILTGNYKEKIPAALRDRVEVIELDRYDDKEKFQIATRYLLPKVMKNQGLSSSQFELTPAALQKVIQGYTREPGVRQLEKKLDHIAGVVTTKRQFSKNPKAYPKVVITEREVTKNTYLGEAPFTAPTRIGGDIPGEVNGLAWTEMGGDTLPVEVNVTPSRGEGLQLGAITGNVQEVMRESAQTAIGYLDPVVKAGRLKVKEAFHQTDGARVSFHFPQAAIPKDGPSAGVAMVTAMVSAITGIPVRSEVAMTGEVRLHGQVLPIGGLKEKVDAAYRAGVKTIFIPEANRRDLAKIPAEQLAAIEIIPVKHVEEILQKALAADPFLPAGQTLGKSKPIGFMASWKP